MDQHRLRRALRQRLRCQNMLDLRSANTEGQRAERAVSTSVAIAADDSHARLREPQLRANHMHNALLGRVHVEEANLEFAAIFLQRFDLFFCDRIKNWGAPWFGRDIVVNCGDRPKWFADLATSDAQPIKCLWGSNLVDEVQIHVKQCGLAWRRRDDMLVPNLFEEGA